MKDLCQMGKSGLLICTLNMDLILMGAESKSCIFAIHAAFTSLTSLFSHVLSLYVTAPVCSNVCICSRKCCSQGPLNKMFMGFIDNKVKQMKTEYKDELSVSYFQVTGCCFDSN